MMVSAMRVLGFASLLFAAVQSNASEGTRVDLYTMGAGEDLFSKFGHAALCVTGDDFPEEGLCYNYGTSDFSRPIGLGWEVVRGRARFWVSVSDRESMIEAFAAEDRTIYRQALPLSEKQAKRLASALSRDAMPENREYVYNHFLENCSTRPRDHIDHATGGELSRVRLSSVGTYRDYATEGLSRASALLVPASDFLLGRWADREIDAYAAMFIPDVLRAGVASAFGVRPDTVYVRRLPPIPAKVESGRRLTWAACFLAVAASASSLFSGTRGKRVFRKLGGGLLGGLGMLLLLAAVVSVLPELRRNELLLVFFPLDFFLLSSNRAFVVSYSTMRLAILAVVAALSALGVLIQPLWPFWFLSAGVLGVIRVGASGRSYTTRP